MKKNISVLLLFGCILLLQLTTSMNAQVFSEAPVTISEKGERLSNMIYVKFLPGDLIDIPKDKKDVDGNFRAR